MLHPSFSHRAALLSIFLIVGIVSGVESLRLLPPAFLAPSVVVPTTASPSSSNLSPSMHRRHQQRTDDRQQRMYSKLHGSDDDDDLQLLPISTTQRTSISQIRHISTTKLQAQTSADNTEAPDPESSSLSEILFIVAPLLLIYISNQWSRYSISYLVDFSTPDATAAASAFEAMNVDLQFTQSQYGLLASTAFTALFALTSLIAGNLADKYDRKILTLGSCAIWTLATFATSQAHSYNEVLAARVIMGGACAFAVPAAYTLIADKVSKDKRAFSNSIYGSGVYVGGALSSLSLLLDESVGWRGTLGAVGAFGVVSAAAAGVLLPSDSDRDNTQNKQQDDEAGDALVQMQQQKEENSLLQNSLEILSIPRVRYLFLASFFRFCSGLMIAVWKAPYYKAAFPGDASSFALQNALIIGVIGAGSGIAGGYIADGLGAWIKEAKDKEGSPSIVLEYFDEQSIRLLLPIIGSLLAIPTFYFTTHSPDAFETAMLWLSLEYLVAECWLGSTIAVLQSTVGSTKAGTAQGMFVLTGALGNLAPTLLGWIYGNQVTEQSSSSAQLGNLLAMGVCAGYLLSSIFFAVSVSASGESNIKADA